MWRKAKRGFAQLWVRNTCIPLVLTLQNLFYVLFITYVHDAITFIVPVHQ